jgi:hypothetical protein
VIVVTAAGGPTGTAVVRALWSRGEQVRAMVGTGRPHRQLTALSVDVHCRRLMFDHYRAHGFAGSPQVLEALVGRPARTFAEHLQRLGAELESVGPAAAGETR